MTGSELAQDSQMVTCSTMQQIALTLLLYLLDCITNLSYEIRKSGGQGRENNANIILEDVFSGGKGQL